MQAAQGADALIDRMEDIKAIAQHDSGRVQFHYNVDGTDTTLTQVKVGYIIRDQVTGDAKWKIWYINPGNFFTMKAKFAALDSLIGDLQSTLVGSAKKERVYHDQ